MNRLAKYMKPYLPLLGLSIILLFIQAYSNLALPDYMSDIVNVGIQQGGIDNAAALAVRKGEMDRLLFFLTQKEREAVLNNYLLVSKDSSDFQNYLSRYPVLKDGPVYILTDTESTVKEELDSIMGKAWLIVSGIENGFKNPSISSGWANFGIDLTKIPKGTDPFLLLKMMPAEQLVLISRAIEEKLSSMSPSMITQAAAASVKAEYKALGMDVSRLQTDYMLHTGYVMLLITLIAAAATISTGFLSARIAAGFARDLRYSVFERVESFSSGSFEKFSTASLITRSTNDIMQIQMVTGMLVTMVFYAPIIGVGGIIRAVGKSTSMWWIIALAVGVLLIVVFTLYRVAVPKFKAMQKLMDRLNLVGREGLSGMMVVRAFNRQEYEEKRFDKVNRDLTDTMLFVNRVLVVLMPFMLLIMNGLSLLIIWIGAKQVASSSMQVGDMMAFMQYAMQIVFAFLMLSMMFIMLPRAAVSAGRIADVLETDPVIIDPEEPKTPDLRYKGTVEFKNVSFRYPGAEEDVLHDISFIMKPGETTAFIGPTGSGKSTIVNLIPRFYDVTDGAVLVGGTDVRNLLQGQLRDNIGYVPQKATLFSGTIKSNLRYADENATIETLRDAAGIAQALDFIDESENGIDSEISQAGGNISGGQKQRLSIARAIVKKPPVFIFDDCFSALDFKTDSMLRGALKKRVGSSSILIVTQRVATVKTAHQIIVIDEGRIVGRGTHQLLMENCETYREIALSQLTKEELA